MISVQVTEDSLSPFGARLTTMVMNYPRFIHSQLMTHRVFSRNSASSRAVPVEKMITKATEETVLPLVWGSNKKGMQAGPEIDNTEDANQLWLETRDLVIEQARKLSSLGVHKQHVNRMLEPFLHMQVVVSATDWSNFLKLRLPEDAQPEIQFLAREIQGALQNHEPKILRVGDWHLPFTDGINNLSLQDRLKVSAARCARVSYYLHENGQKSDIESDKKLHDILLGGFHMSPLEHQAMVVGPSHYGNFFGFMQYRKMIPNEGQQEYAHKYNLDVLLES